MTTANMLLLHTEMTGTYSLTSKVDTFHFYFTTLIYAEITTVFYINSVLISSLNKLVKTFKDKAF